MDTTQNDAEGHDALSRNGDRLTDLSVGRDSELKSLRFALEDALSGQGRVLRLTGDPGIGKTHLVKTFERSVWPPDVRVLWGACQIGRSYPAYWPWIQILGTYAAGIDPEKLRAELGAGAAVIAAIVPSLQGLGAGSDAPVKAGRFAGSAQSSTPADSMTYDIHRSVLEFLQSASSNQPLIIIIDDMHNADQESLDMLEFISSRIDGSRILLVVIDPDIRLSPENRASHTINELTHNPHYREIQLTPISFEATREMATHFLDTQLGEEQMKELYAWTEGNPLFLTEQLNLISQRGDLNFLKPADAPEGNFALTPKIKSVTRRRLEYLSPPCVKALKIAALVGREFPFDLLKGCLTETDPIELLKLLEEVQAARLIEPLATRYMTYSFAHGIIHETIFGEVTVAEKPVLHAQIAEALEHLYGGNLKAHMAELAHHYGEAAPILGNGKLVRYSILAGEDLLERKLYEDALFHFERARQARRGLLPANDSDIETASLQEGLGLALGGVGRWSESWHNLSAALRFYMDHGDIAKTVYIATHPLTYSTNETQLNRLLAEALTMVRPDSLDAGKLRARHALAVNEERGDYRQAIDDLNSALAIAQHENDQALTLLSMSYQLDIYASHLMWSECLLKRDEIKRVRLYTEEPQAEIWSAYWAAMAALIVGDIRRAKIEVAAMERPARKLRDCYSTASERWLNAIIARFSGNWEEARTINEQGLEASPRDPRLLASRAIMECELGDFESAFTFLEHLIAVMESSDYLGPDAEAALTAWSIPLIGLISGETRYLGLARNVAEDAIQRFANSLPIAKLFADSSLGLIAVLEDDLASAGRHYEEIKTRAEGYMYGAFGMSIHRLKGLLAKSIGELDLAISHFREAEEYCNKLKDEAELGWSSYLLAESLLDRSSDGDMREAFDKLEEILSIADRLDMRPLSERASHLRDEIAASLRNSYPAGLSQREVDVLRLVVDGLTDTEIADSLKMGTRTVNTHVHHILEKTDSANRAQATAFALRHDLCE